MPEALKNMYNSIFIADLTEAVVAAYPAFDGEFFTSRIFDDDWDGRELKDRMRHITLSLRPLLPDGYRDALALLRDASARMSGYDFEVMIFPDFVEVFGLDDSPASLPALEQFTQQSSSEFAIRPFILRDPVGIMAQMELWAKHENEHVRRLASEGCRPRLPWAMALPIFKADPAPVLRVLEYLKTDSSEYVRRSVANNLNDISKDNPPDVIETLRRWSAVDTPAMAWLTRHALRTLIKKGDPDALGLLGYDRPSIEVRDLSVTPTQVAMGESLRVSCEITSMGETTQNLMIDYVIHFMKANGKQAEKVFKLKKTSLEPGETMRIEKAFSFRAINTRKYYPGDHAVEMQINGQRFGYVTFIITN